MKDSRPKNHRRRKKRRRICGEGKNLKGHWPFAWRLTKMTLYQRLFPENPKGFRKTFLKNTFEELLLVFQLFKQFDLEIRYFIFNFQKRFSHRIFKNVSTFSHFLRFCRNVLPQCRASDWNSVFRLKFKFRFKWWYTVVGWGEMQGYVKTRLFKIWSWNIFKILLSQNSSLACVNLSLQCISRMTFFADYWFF